MRSGFEGSRGIELLRTTSTGSAKVRADAMGVIATVGGGSAGQHAQDRRHAAGNGVQHKQVTDIAITSNGRGTE